MSDESGRICAFNRGAEVITAWPREKAIGRPMDEVFRLVNRNNGSAVNFSDAARGPLIHLAKDTLLLDQSASQIEVDSATSVLRDDQGNPAGMVFVFRDASGARHGALHALHQDITLAVAESLTMQGMLQICAEAFVRNINAAFARIWTADATGTLLLLRGSAGLYTNLHGRYSRVRVGQHLVGLVAKERTPIISTNLSDDPRTDNPEWAQREHIKSFAGYPLIVNNQLVGVLAVFGHQPYRQNVLDAIALVSRTIAVGIERKRLEDQVRYTHKMEALGQLAGGVAHDFNNLLTVISGNGQFLLESPLLDPDSRRFAMEIVETAERAAKLSQQLLAFGRKQVLDAKVHDLNKLFRNLDKMMRRIIGEDICLESHLADTPAYVFADQSQLEQVIVNLVINARDAMPNGGTLTIEVRHTELDVSFWHGEADSAPGKYVAVTVSDTGVGMTRDVLARIFEPYFTTKEHGKGTGLGLATVYGIVRQSGGYVHVYSEPGLGTTFRIYLPLATQEEPVREAPAQSDELMRGNETVLLVEDDPHVRAMCRRILVSCGYTVLPSGNGLEALQLSNAYDGHIHLIVTDVVMPGIGGKELVERLTAVRPGIRALFMSGYTDEALIRRGIVPATANYLQKPFTPKILSQRVRGVLDAPPATAHSNAMNAAQRQP